MNTFSGNQDFLAGIQEFTISTQEALQDYLLECATFVRAEILKKLKAHDALAEGGGWAIFGEGVTITTEEGLELTSEKTTLIMIHQIVSALGVDKGVSMRVCSNEMVRGSMGDNRDDTVQIMTKDCTLNSEGAAWFHLDAIELFTEKVPETVNGVLIMVDSNGVMQCTGPESTPLEPAVLVPGSMAKSDILDWFPFFPYFPFGHPSQAEAGLEALEVMWSIFEEIKDSAPLHRHIPAV